MADSPGSGSPDPLEGEGPSGHAQDSNLSPEQWTAIKDITERVYKFRTKDGHDPTKVFHRKVNKRIIPDYYDVIKEPVALSTLRAKILQKSYQNFEEYVRDVALITHNAQTYNRPEAGAYHDAITLKEIFQKEFRKLVEDGVIPTETAQYPDLGELPPVEDLPAPEAVQEEADDQDEEEEEEEEDDDDDSDDEGGRRRRRKAHRASAAHLKSAKGPAKDEGTGRRRGRPPKVDTPMEARIKNILKGIRRYRNDQNQFIVASFEKLPDKAELPDYYMEIKEPLAVEQIKRKAKRKKYNSVDHFVRDMDLMFHNCMQYNVETSEVYQDALILQRETHRLAAIEKAKPDTEFALDEGKLPLPDGIMFQGELWKVGNWVHIQNPNDVTKPIVAQIYRTWRDTDGEEWINACWYYRPEQTVHHFEKHFLPHEVMKTGQYRDHRVQEIVDRCFVMFVTRFSRGRPRGFPPGKEVYVCESRYNEDKHRMNKIKTWASCLPDEVREKDYEMDLFDNNKRVKKVPSPLLHLLKDDSKETDAKPRWGAPNAPPIVGAIYKGDRDENQSPPPEPTPSPPPQPPPQARPPHTSSAYANDYHRNDMRPQASHTAAGQAYSYTPSQAHRFQQSSTSPGPPQHYPGHQYGQQTAHSGYTPAASAYDHGYGGAHTRYGATQPHRPPGHHSVPSAAAAGAGQIASSGSELGQFPRADEVFRLPETANSAIPEAVRNHFQQDEDGHVLFFTAPPLDVLPPPVKPGSAVGHTARYLAAKIKAEHAGKEKHLTNGAGSHSNASEDVDMANDQAAAHAPAKRVKKDHAADSTALSEKVRQTQHDAMQLWIRSMQDDTTRIYRDLYGVHWQAGQQVAQESLEQRQSDARAMHESIKLNRARREEASRRLLMPGGTYRDDIDPRYGKL